MINNTDEFLNEAKNLDLIVKTTYGLSSNQSSFEFLKKQKGFASKKKVLGTIQEMRNILSHSPKFKMNYIFSPSFEIIQELKEITSLVQHEPKALEKAIMYKDITKAYLNDNFEKLLISMNENDYTNIPIVDNNDHIIGIFNERTLFKYMISNKIIDIEDIKTFSDLSSYIDLDNYKDIMLFCSKKSYLYQISKIIDSHYQYNNRIEIIFITENGHKHEKLLALLTPWDLIH